VHAAAIQEWAGIPVGTAAPGLARDLICVVDGFGSVGRRHVLARRARRRAEQWATRVIEGVRRGSLEVPADSAVAVIATHRDEHGHLLRPRVAAVELLNVLRPTVAVAYFVAFAAQQLALDSSTAHRLRTGDDAVYESFACELRRLYPFVPMLAAKVRRRTEYHGTVLPRGRRVLLDVYGTLHDPAYWRDAELFDVDRFHDEQADPFGYFPQGGGDTAHGHRCPGERTTIELITVAARMLVQDVPALEGARIPVRRMPTRPAAA
jgi:fatty-acid peroxygenase